MAKKKSNKGSVVRGQGSAKSADLVTIADGVQVPRADVAHIAPDLWPLAVAIDSLKADPRNARRHPEKNLASIRASLKSNGQQKPISIDADSIILAGNGTWTAARELGWKYIARVRSNLTGARARAWAIQDNRTSELAEWDREELERQVEEITAELDDISLEDLGFDDKQLEALANGNFEVAHGFAPKPPPKDPEPDQDELVPQFKIIINCRDEDEQAKLIQEFEMRGLSYTAPSA